MLLLGLLTSESGTAGHDRGPEGVEHVQRVLQGLGCVGGWYGELVNRVKVWGIWGLIEEIRSDEEWGLIRKILLRELL